MNEAFGKIIEKLVNLNIIAGEKYECDYELQTLVCAELEEAIEIVKHTAEEYATDTNVGTNGWIPCSERLPEEAFGCLVTVMDCEPSTQTEFENILPYVVGYDGDGWNDADGERIPFEVIAWQPLPQPYQPKGE